MVLGIDLVGSSPSPQPNSSTIYAVSLNYSQSYNSQTSYHHFYHWNQILVDLVLLVHLRLIVGIVLCFGWGYCHIHSQYLKVWILFWEICLLGNFVWSRWIGYFQYSKFITLQNHRDYLSTPPYFDYFRHFLNIVSISQFSTGQSVLKET